MLLGPIFSRESQVIGNVTDVISRVPGVWVQIRHLCTLSTASQLCVYIHFELRTRVCTWMISLCFQKCNEHRL